MKLKRLISCGLVGILTGVGILMNAKVSSAEDKSVGVLTFPYGNSKKISSYTETWSVDLNNHQYTIVNANNNNNGWKFIKFGKKIQHLLEKFQLVHILKKSVKLL